MMLQLFFFFPPNNHNHHREKKPDNIILKLPSPELILVVDVSIEHNFILVSDFPSF